MDFVHSKTIFEKLLNLMSCINKLYLCCLLQAQCRLASSWRRVFLLFHFIFVSSSITSNLHVAAYALVILVHLVTKDHHLYTNRIHTDDCVVLPKLHKLVGNPHEETLSINILQLNIVRENCLLVTILGSQRMRITMLTPLNRMLHHNSLHKQTIISLNKIVIHFQMCSIIMYYFQSKRHWANDGDVF